MGSVVSALAQRSARADISESKRQRRRLIHSSVFEPTSAFRRLSPRFAYSGLTFHISRPNCP